MQIATKSQALKAVLVQLGATLVFSAALGMVAAVHAYSALAGGAIATIANAFFSSRVFADYRAQEFDRLVARIYGAEIAKLFLVALLFAGAVQWLDPLSGAALFGVFLIVHLMPGLMSLFN